MVAHLAQVASANALIKDLNDLDGAGHERNLRELVGFDGLEWSQPAQRPYWEKFLTKQ